MMQMLRRPLKVPLAGCGIVRQLISQRSQPGECAFLIYHRVDGSLPLELDLEPELFRRQMEYLASTCRVITYEQALDRLANPAPTDSTAFVLTFDDGYEDFYTRVFPLLREYDLPAILYVTTGFVEDGIPYPMLSSPNADAKPVTWDMLGKIVESGLVTVGAHTHTHIVLSDASEAQIEDELAKSQDLFERRLGLQPAHFAYPRAEAGSSARALVEKAYASAVVGGGMRATPVGFDRYSIPRIPIRRSDGWQFFRAKLRGWLDDEEPMYERLRVLTGRKTGRKAT